MTDRTDEGLSAGDTEACCLGAGVETQSEAGHCWCEVTDVTSVTETETNCVVNTAH